MPHVLKALLMGAVAAGVAAAQPAISQNFNFGQAKPGAELIIPGSGFPSAPAGISLTVQPKALQIAAKGATATSLVFALPSLDPGDYTATIAFPAEGTNPARTVAVPGTLTVPRASQSVTEAPKAVTFGGVAPSTAYPKGDRFSFEIYGENFPDPQSASYLLELSGRIISPLEVRGADAACPATSTPCLKWLGPEHLSVSNVERADVYQSSTSVRLRINGPWFGPKSLILSRWQDHWPFVAALGFLVLTFFIIVAILRGRDALNRKSGISTRAPRYGVITRFLLDADTNTYSLSKFQVFTWLIITVFAYVYVLLCRITIQGVMEWPQFPSSLAGMFGLSLGAMVAATAVTEAKGNKGAGPEGPSFADFFSSGGVVAADRFQFFLWTLVGFIGYVSLLWFSDPTKIATAPSLPDGLLYLMGVSAGGYVGGKLTRAAGPNITGLKAVLDRGIDGTTALTLRIAGDNLSPSATYQIDGKDVKTAKRPAEVILPPPNPPDSRPVRANELKVVINALDSTCTSAGAHLLRFINDDGQFAESQYSLAVSIEGSITLAAAAGDTSATIPTMATASGVKTLDFELQPASGGSFKAPGIVPASPGPLIVRFSGATATGPATLIITAPDGSTVRAAIK